MRILIPLADGCESLETVALANVLRRGDAEVCLAALGASTTITATRDLRLIADTRFDTVLDQEFDAIVLPGGLRGAETFAADERLIRKLTDQRMAHRWFGAICAAPALALAPHGLLDGKKATCFPALRDRLLHWVDQPVVVDGHCITSQGPATAIAFGLEWLERLGSLELRRRVAADLLVSE